MSDAAQQYGVLDFLRQDTSSLSRQTVSLIEALELQRRPRMMAYLGRVLFVTALFGATLWMTDALPHLPSVARTAFPQMLAGVPPRAQAATAAWLTSHGAAWENWEATFWLVLGLIGYAKVKTTRYVLANGRLQVFRGLIWRRVDTHDLWLVHEITLHQTPTNRVTGDGTLVLRTNPQSAVAGGGRHRQSQRVVIRGLAHGLDLMQIYQRLQNLKFMLRANPAVKGIIQ